MIMYYLCTTKHMRNQKYLARMWNVGGQQNIFSIQNEDKLKNAVHQWVMRIHVYKWLNPQSSNDLHFVNGKYFEHSSIQFGDGQAKWQFSAIVICSYHNCVLTVHLTFSSLPTSPFCNQFSKGWFTDLVRLPTKYYRLRIRNPVMIWLIKEPFYYLSLAKECFTISVRKAKKVTIHMLFVWNEEIKCFVKSPTLAMADILSGC